MVISRLERCTYLGIMICAKTAMLLWKDKHQYLLRNFAKWSPAKKCTLFKTLCSNMYCYSIMWCDRTDKAAEIKNNLLVLVKITEYLYFWFFI